MRWFSLVVFLLGASTASAATVMWDEAVDGDAGAAASPVPVHLASGQNILRGDMLLASYAPSSSDVDAYRLVVPTGYRIDSLSLEISLNSGVALSRAIWTLYDGPTSSGDSLFNVQTDYHPANTLEMALLEGEYLLCGCFGATVSGPDYVQDYQWEVSVSAIPVPGAIWLMGSGLLGLLGWRRRGR